MGYMVIGKLIFILFNASQEQANPFTSQNKKYSMKIIPFPNDGSSEFQEHESESSHLELESFRGNDREQEVVVGAEFPHQKIFEARAIEMKIMTQVSGELEKITTRVDQVDAKLE